jgi:hypothetical protein
MRRLAGIFVALALCVLPVDTRAASDMPTERPAQGITVNMDYGTAALVTAAVIAGAVAINAFVAPNVGTVLGALYVGHLVVEAAIVLTGAGAGWGFGLWDDAPTDVSAPAKAN